MDVNAMRQQDAADYQKFRQAYISGAEDSTKVENWDIVNEMAKGRRMMGYSYQIRNAAELVYFEVKDQQVLAQAVQWVKKANEYYPHFSHKGVYAALLAKTGKKQEAIAMMQQAAKDPILASHDGLRAMFADNAEKIRSGKPLENLWHL
jgi:hypothetical protein